MRAQLQVDARNALGEGVLWCERTQRVFWTDIMASTLWCHHPATSATRRWALPERLGSFAFTPDENRLLLGLAKRLAFFDLASGELDTVCRVEPELPTTRVNDGRCDRQGRFVFGTMNEAPDLAPLGSFYRLNPDLSLQRLGLPQAAIANSIAFSLDGATMYFCDSPTRTICCCDYDAESGAVSKLRRFADLRDSGPKRFPDGSIVDAQGHLWNAEWRGHRVVRYTPQGAVERVVEVPVTQPSCLAFGGAALDELFITSARVEMSDAALAGEPQAGGLFHAVVSGVSGLVAERFPRSRR